MSFCPKCEFLADGGFCKKHKKSVQKCSGGCTLNRGKQTKDRIKSLVVPNDTETSEKLAPFLDKVLHGDCLESLKKIPDDSVDVVVTSPPYNLKNSTTTCWNASRESMQNWAAFKGKNLPGLYEGYDAHDDNMPHEEYVAWQRSCLEQMVRIIKPSGFIFYNHKQRVQNGLLQHRMDLMDGFPLRQIIFWLRNGGGIINYNQGYFMNNCEQIFMLAKSKMARLKKDSYPFGLVWHIGQETNNRHPAPFPVELPDRCLDSQYLSKDSVVLDPFMGSGTTAISAIKHGIHYIGMEISESYCEMANLRIEKFREEFEKGTLEMRIDEEVKIRAANLRKEVEAEFRAEEYARNPKQLFFDFSG